jgi:hypothetical protein
LSLGWLFVQAAKARAHKRVIANFFFVLLFSIMVAKIIKIPENHSSKISGIFSN